MEENRILQWLLCCMNGFEATEVQSVPVPRFTNDSDGFGKK